MESNQSSTQRRRSERVSKSIPLIVRGTDLLGQPFEERTSTATLNLHGCRYSSTHHLPRNTWVTLELPQDVQGRSLRARVAWIQRPHSLREFFQVAVELESPANIWNVDPPPADWEMGETSTSPRAKPEMERDVRAPEQSFENGAFEESIHISTERIAADMTTQPSDFARPLSSADPQGQERTSEPKSPLLREWHAEFERQASQTAEAAAARAAEKIQRTLEEFEQARNAAREDFSNEMSTRQKDFLAGLRAQFDDNLHQARELVRDLESGVHNLRAENNSALELTSRIAQAQLQLEAAQEAQARQHSMEASKEEASSIENAAAQWHERLESEMAVAQGQWTELLQSSLDGGIERLVAQLSGRTQDVLHEAEQKMSDRFTELRQPLGQLHSEARETLSGVKSALEQEVGRARGSLAEIEHSASRMKEYSAQLEAASHDTLNELHRRLENILEAQTDEMNRRAESAAASVPERLAPTLDSLGHQFIDRVMGEVESRLARRVERIPELLHQLAAREIEAKDSLRLHRERLRQVSDNNQREAAGQMAATLESLRHDFESARKVALAKWSEELDTTGVRVTHAAGESIGQSSEWFQQEARARLQVLVEQALTTAGTGLEEKISEGTRQLESRLEEQSSDRVSQMHQQLDGVADEISGRTRTQLHAAAETAAASFGQVLRDISDREVGQFASSSHSALQEREQDLKQFTGQLVSELEASASGLVDRFREQMVSQVQTSVAEGRSALAAEFASALDAYHADRDVHEREWVQVLDRVSGEAADKYHDRLQAACDSWVMSSVRRLNEHGQNTIESLMRSADQSLRDSCSKVFEGLSEMLRDRTTNAAAVAGFKPGSSHDPGEPPPTPHNQAASHGASA